jgi:hypothetical protein
MSEIKITPMTLTVEQRLREKVEDELLQCVTFRLNDERWEWVYDVLSPELQAYSFRQLSGQLGNGVSRQIELECPIIL